MIVLYQIGAVKIRAEGSGVSALEIDRKRTFQADIQQSNRSPNIRIGGYRQFADPAEMSFKGTVYTRDGFSPQDQINEIMSYGGRPYVDLIAYYDSDLMDSVIWMTCQGIITEIGNAISVDDSSTLPSQAMSVDFSVKLETYWRAMNPYLWEPNYTQAEADSFRVISGPYKSALPDQANSDSLFSFWKKRYASNYEMYNPAYWDDMYAYPYGEAEGWQIANGLEYRVRPPRKYWSAPPEAKYAFTNLPQTGTLSIAVESEITSFTTETLTSTIDLADLHTALLPTGLLTTDILIVTDGLFAPGFVLRDGSPVLFSGNIIAPEWSYENSTPGELLGSDNMVTITAPDNNVLAARLHCYRTF